MRMHFSPLFSRRERQQKDNLLSILHKYIWKCQKVISTSNLLLLNCDNIEGEGEKGEGNGLLNRAAATQCQVKV